jgi:hypothetical protein
MNLNHILVAFLQADREADIARHQLAARAVSAKSTPPAQIASFLRLPRLSPAR